MAWKTFSGKPLRSDIRQAVKDSIIREQARGCPLRVCIGTDSQSTARTVHFATVIVFVREKQGGFMFVNESFTNGNGMPLKERLIMEVGKSVETAYQIDGILREYKVPLEIHADINTDEESRSYVAMKEALGYIKGMGYQYKLKPEAFASSSCADKYV